MSRAISVLVAVLCVSVLSNVAPARAEMTPSAAVDRIPVFPADIAALQCPAINLDKASGKPLAEIFKAEQDAQTALLQSTLRANLGPAAGTMNDKQIAAVTAASDPTLAQCGDDNYAGLLAMGDVDRRESDSMHPIDDSFRAALDACPDDGELKEESCVKKVRAAHRAKVSAALAAYVREAAPKLNQAAQTIKTCALRREKVAADVKAANIPPAFAMMALQYPVMSWALLDSLMTDRAHVCDVVANDRERYREP